MLLAQGSMEHLTAAREIVARTDFQPDIFTAPTR